MKFFNQQRQDSTKVEELILKMQSEIEQLRMINYRYCLKHGNSIKGGFVSLPSNYSFRITVSDDKKDEDGNNLAFCSVIEYDKLGMESDYQKILKGINDLS